MKTFLRTFIFLLLACNAPVKNESEEAVDKQFKKSVGNISFTFPSRGYAFENRDQLIAECLEGIKSNCSLIGLHHYTDTIDVIFLTSREEMKKYTDMTASGITLVQPKILYIVANGDPKEVKPPIRHELMHMISMTTWGYPRRDSNWMNEGLAALAENNCNDYNVEQIYRYLSDKEMLISMDTLTSDFYSQPEMIAYHQAAYIAQYLLLVYGVENFMALWTQGFAEFEKIYGIPFSQATSDLNRKAKEVYPFAPDINWNTFKRGCF